MLRKCLLYIVIIMMPLLLASSAFSAVTAEEAAKLGGTALTDVGAEKAGNAAGTIPAYTGGVTVPPKSYVPGSGIRTSPFADEKPLFSITQKNMNQHLDKLTEGSKALLKKYPDYRMDVYPTHRSVAFPASVLEHTKKNALTASTYNNGRSIKGTWAGYPFPIPKNGFEVMWNHLLRYVGRCIEFQLAAYYVDANGVPTWTSEGNFFQESPYYDENPKRYDSDIYWKFSWKMVGPPRVAGEHILVFDPVNIGEKGRTIWQYLPGQRRVKLAPQLAFDSPNNATGGVNNYDDYDLFNGSMERFDFKLIGKKEVYVRYNDYRLGYERIPLEKLFLKKFINPDYVRWELHRVWIVEGTLVPGKRHMYSKRRLYIDEDSWYAMATDNYDGAGNLYRVGWASMIPTYDIPAPYADVQNYQDLIAGSYNLHGWLGHKNGYLKTNKLWPPYKWSPESMAGSGVR